MVVVTVQNDGRIQLPETVCERLGLRPGTRLALEEGNGDGGLQLRVLPEEAELVEKDGVWVIRFPSRSLEESEEDWVDQFREERLDSLVDWQ